jgi:TPR repeat protein
MAQHGVIYIINNKMRDGEERFKVGRTYDLERRLNELNGETSNIGKFVAVAYYPVSDMAKAETDTHKALQQFRIQNNKEFFEGNQLEIIKIVESIVSKYKPESFTPNERQEPNQAQQNYEDKFKEKLPLAEQGDSEAQKDLGWHYHEGLGVEQDYREAVKWYRRSAKQGNAQAQYLLGSIYQKGQEVTQDYIEAVRLYRLAADKGDSEAQNSLGIMYAQGTGVSQDENEAVKWYRRSAEQGNVRAQCNLGLIYEKGIVVSQNHRKAVEWYRLSAERGYVYAQYNLGRIYYKRAVVPQDYLSAYMWLNLSGSQRNEDAVKLRKSLEIKMTPQQIQKAQEMARNWKPIKK